MLKRLLCRLTLLWGLAAALPAAAQAPVRAADGTPQLLHLPPAGTAARSLPTDSRALLRQQLQLSAAEELRPLRAETDELGQLHERFGQYYRGVKVEHGVYTLHRATGVLSGELKRIPAGLSVVPGMSEAQALGRALAAVGARRYRWQDPAEEAALRRQSGNAQASYRPRGELVLVQDYREPDPARRPLVLAWKFDVYARQPLSRDWVYVDARSGAVVLRDARLKHLGATGGFDTHYSGRRPAATEVDANGNYSLRDYTRGDGIETLDLGQRTTLSTAVDFTDKDNDWTAAEFNNPSQDQAALDAHWAMQQVYDYWLSVHQRRSYDGRGSKLVSYVHYGQGYDNANWDGTAMLFGDGGPRFSPLTALDLCAHETAHGVCQETAGLVYQYESGALNEGLSDLWAASIEQSVDPAKQTWTIGEEVCRAAGGLRSMSDPGAATMLTTCPANYKGRNWSFGPADFGGVHTNCGVLSHWYYLLSVGKAGVNEQGQAYSVAGIGLPAAARIAYRAERLYLTPNSDYRSARVFTIQAAEDLFGAGSAEVQAVTEAWYAVGLGPGRLSAPVQPCLADDAPLLTAAASAATLCGDERLTLTATAAFSPIRRLRNASPTPLPDGALTFTALPLYNYGASVQHGLENVYRSYGDLVGVRVRLRHEHPEQLTLRLVVSGSSSQNYVVLAQALPAYGGPGAAVLDLTFMDGGLPPPTSLSSAALTATWQPATPLATPSPGVLSSISLEARDNQAGGLGSIELVELLFQRAAADVPAVRWAGPGVDTVGRQVRLLPPPPTGSGPVSYRYTVLASDPYFGCTTTQEVSVRVSQPLLAAATPTPELCAAAGQPLPMVDLRVTAQDSLPGQTYRWTGPGGYAATGQRQRVLPGGGGRLRYVVRTTAPGTGCPVEREVLVLVRRPAPGPPADADSLACAGGPARLRSRPFENQLTGPYQFAGSVLIPDFTAAGVRIPLTVTGPANGFFDLRGIRVNLTHAFMGELDLYVEAPDGTRVLLSHRNGGNGRSFRNTVFVDSVGAPLLRRGADPYAGSWQVDDPAGLSALRRAAPVGTWYLWVRDNAIQNVGAVSSWGLVLKDNDVGWRGPGGFTARGSSVSSPLLAAPGWQQYVATTSYGSCAYHDTLRVRVVSGPEWRPRSGRELAEPANWSCLPTPATDAELRGAGAAQPVLSSGRVQVRHLSLRAGTALQLNGGTLEVYGDLTLEPGATLTGSGGLLLLKGAGTLTAASPTDLQVPQLQVDLPATDTVRLGQDLRAGRLSLQQGILKTQGFTLTLAPGARLSETATAYVSGRLQASADVVQAGRLYDFDGAGLTLSADAGSALPGPTQLTRVTDQAIGAAPARSSIRRRYEVSPTQSQGLSMNLRLAYRTAELNGLAAADLQPFRAASLAGPWLPEAVSQRGPGQAWVEAAGVRTLAGTWTLSTPAAMLPVRVPQARLSVTAQPVPFGDAGFALQLPLTRPQPATLVLADLAGREVLRRVVELAAGSNTVSLPEAGRLPAGVYLLRILADGQGQVLRVVRE